MVRGRRHCLVAVAQRDSCYTSPPRPLHHACKHFRGERQSPCGSIVGHLCCCVQVVAPCLMRVACSVIPRGLDQSMSNGRSSYQNQREGLGRVGMPRREPLPSGPQRLGRTITPLPLPTISAISLHFNPLGSFVFITWTSTYGPTWPGFRISQPDVKGL